uniref:Uncharacterized protein n=1 Tax=Anguilla anguilla TaxID=7936 RepID=A0A0E9RRN3_ANGAN
MSKAKVAPPPPGCLLDINDPKGSRGSDSHPGIVQRTPVLCLLSFSTFSLNFLELKIFLFY